jgi:hypothetical protein
VALTIESLNPSTGNQRVNARITAHTVCCGQDVEPGQVLDIPRSEFDILRTANKAVLHVEDAPEAPAPATPAPAEKKGKK